MKKENAYNFEDSGQSLKTNNKYEHDLYHEEDDIKEKIIRVKRFNLPGGGEKWKIFENTKALMTIEGNKLTIKEREYLRTVDGFNFLISYYKNGLTSFSAFKTAVKAKVK